MYNSDNKFAEVKIHVDYCFESQEGITMALSEIAKLLANAMR